MPPRSPRPRANAPATPVLPLPLRQQAGKTASLGRSADGRGPYKGSPCVSGSVSSTASTRPSPSPLAAGRSRRRWAQRRRLPWTRREHRLRQQLRRTRQRLTLCRQWQRRTLDSCPGSAGADWPSDAGGALLSTATLAISPTRRPATSTTSADWARPSTRLPLLSPPTSCRPLSTEGRTNQRWHTRTSSWRNPWRCASGGIQWSSPSPL